MTHTLRFALLTLLSSSAACSSSENLPGGAAGAGGAGGVGGAAAAGGAAATGGAATGGAGSGGTAAGSTGSGGVQSGGAGGTSGASTAGGAGGLGGTSGGSSGAGGSAGVGGVGGTGQAGVQVYILFGQSNMWGEPYPEPEDVTENPNVEVLTRIACGNHEKNEWVTAVPPLHECVGQFGDATAGPGGGDYAGPGVGPGDYFARTLAEAYPNDKILLVPNAIPGVPISQFAVGSATYNDMIARAEMGKERGPIKGILFHQGESDCGSASWPNAVKTIVDAMRSTLGTGDIPFLAGEIPQTSQCQGHNARVGELPGIIENAHVISSAGLSITDAYHFGLADQRTFGTRYGEKMLELLQ